MRSWEALPSVSLQPGGNFTAKFNALGLTDFRAAARYLHRLPYGRNSARADFKLVLSEGRGTCSTKHALLAQLAREQGISTNLTLGIYEMTENNTPGVGKVLEKYKLTCLPEAHCYLTYDGMRIDITRSGHAPGEPIDRFLYEETIEPEQVGAYKVEFHKRFLRDWVAKEGVASQRSWEELWQVREECIARLSQ